MKIYRIYYIILMALFLQSCVKEEAQYNNLDNDQAVKLVTVTNGLNKSAYSFLSFKDFDTFNQTIDDLEDQYNQYDDAFIASYPDLQGEALTDKELEIKWDAYKPFKDFTKLYGLSHSLLDDYIEVESNWLNNEFLDETKDSDIAFLDLEPEQLAMLNADGVVQIGKEIFIQGQNGLITIPDGNTNTLFSFLDNLDFSGLGPISFDSNVWLGLGDLNFDWLPDVTDPVLICHPAMEKRDWWSYNSTRKVKGVVKSQYNWLWGSLIKSKTKYYRRYWLFGYHWVNTRASSLTAALDGFADDETSNCGDNALVFDENVDFKHRTNRSRVKYQVRVNYPYQFITTQTQHLKGIHKKGSNFRKEHYIW